MENNPLIQNLNQLSSLENNNLENKKRSKPKSHDKLSFFKKLCYGVGGLPYQMCSTSIGLFITPFLLEIAGLRPGNVSLILLAGRGWDAITDPLIGLFVHKTNTRLGKLRPWIIFSAPFSVICYMMIWYVPDLDRVSKTIWYLVFNCLFQTFLSCLHVPYTTLTMYLTHSQKERDSVTGYRMSFEVVGVLFAALIQGVMISLYNKKVPCEELLSFNSTSYFSRNSSSLSSIIPNYSKFGEGFLITAAIMSTIYLFCSVTTFLGTKELKDVIKDKDKHFFRSLKKVFTHKSYILLLLAFLFNSLAIQLLEYNFALYCKYAIDAKKEYQNMLIVLLLSSIISVPFWNMIMFRVGKKLAFAFGLIILIPILIPMYFFDFNFKAIWVVYIIAGVAGLSIAVNILLPWSMLPDVIDEFMIKTGERKESIFYSFFVFFTKLSGGFSVAITSLILEFHGYINCPNGCCTQPNSVAFVLKIFISPIPIIFTFISLFFIWIYPINEDRRKEIKEKLISIRKNLK